MRYYTVAIADDSYKGVDPLTYQHPDELALRQLVLVPIRNILATGMIIEIVDKPTFKTKDIAIILQILPMPTSFPAVMTWLQNYYGAPLGVAAQQLLPGSLTEKAIAKQKAASILSAPDQSVLPVLNGQQQAVIAEFSATGTNLLHGNTGTGKTRIYIEQALRAFEMAKSVVILTPEISLTSQLVQSLAAVFGNRVIVTHSGLTAGKRRDIWLRIAASREALIIIGPRSALFMPLHAIGLIVIDESHDDAYKQQSMPTYSALRVAAFLAQQHNAQLILGSATPSVSEYYYAKAKSRPVIRLTERATVSDEASAITKTIDMRERSNFTQNHYLSDELLALMRTAQSKGEQSLLFLNRRGTSRITLCAVCGWRALCEHCGTPMTFHGDSFSLKCHACSRTQKVPGTCPDCSSPDVIFKSEGTKAIEETVRGLFPSATVMRFDTDNKKADRLEQHYDAIKDGSVDILIGTQLLAKGLDLPKLSVVGVISADLSLQVPDFTAEEKTYQLLSQVVGRVGRGHRAGTAIVQTYNPENRAIADALSGNWDDFYTRELEERSNFMFPPYCHLLVLTARRARADSAEKAANDLTATLHALAGVRIEGPMQSYHERVDGSYEWRLIAKAKSRNVLLTIIKDLPSGWRYDIDPSNLL